MTQAIKEFKGDYAFLSNFYEDVSFEWGGYRAATSEHHFQAAKTLDIQERQIIAQAYSPASAKRLGRVCTKRPDWDIVKQDVMLSILRAKFENPRLRGWLLATGDRELIEGNTWGDRYWGMVNGVGENHLGRLLMQVRSEIRATLDSSDTERNAV